MRRVIAFSIACLLVAAGCGAHEERRYGQVTPEMPGGFALPPYKEALPAYAVFPKGALSDREIARVRNLPGVAAAAALTIAQANVRGPSGTVPLQLGATRPLKFRPVSPSPTRDADFVWTSLIGGQAVLTYEAAKRLGVENAAALDIPGLDGIRVGAFAENGAPSNFADVLVSDHIVEKMPGDPVDVLVVGTSEDEDTHELGRALTKAMPGARLLPLIQVLDPSGITADAGPDPIARGTAEAGLGGTMTFTILEDGWIEPDEAWVAANIAQGTVPILGEVTCHRLMIPQLAEALAEVEREGLASLIRPEDYAGCYAPRFIDRNPELPLSNHAFGLAIDLNSDTNQLGTTGDMDPRIVEIFERWGFEWGGHWDRPDPMHFELARLLS